MVGTLRCGVPAGASPLLSQRNFPNRPPKPGNSGGGGPAVHPYRHNSRLDHPAPGLFRPVLGFTPPTRGMIPPTHGFFPPDRSIFPPVHGMTPPGFRMVRPCRGLFPPNRRIISPVHGLMRKIHGFLAKNRGFSPDSTGRIRRNYLKNGAFEQKIRVRTGLAGF